MTTDTLRHVPLFESLDNEAAGELCHLLESLDSKAGTFLCRAGDEGLSGMRDDHSDKRHALSALHDRTFRFAARLTASHLLQIRVGWSRPNALIGK